MNFPASLRDAVATQLTDMSAPGGPLNTDAPHNTWRRYAASMPRLTFRRNVIDRYLEATETPLREGRSALITAGPPGAGKSTLLTQTIADLEGYRRLDADLVKDYLIRQALADGIYDDLLGRLLSDGHTLAPRELAALVHIESTTLIDEIRTACIYRRENVLIEGTLRWPDHGRRILGELAAAHYTKVWIIAVDVPAHLAHAQALERWWTVRQAWTRGEDELGGRYTPPAAIDVCYSGDHSSICAENALALTREADDAPAVALTVYARTATGDFEVVFAVGASRTGPDT